MKARHVLGVDGGGSKTECAVCPLYGGDGVVVRGGGSNHEGVGYERAGHVVRALAEEAFRRAGIGPGDVAGACFAMAGMDIGPDRENIRARIVAPIGLSCPLDICNDAFAGFRAGSPRGVGVCLSLGSGITFCGRNEAGVTMQFERPAPLGIDSRIHDALLAEYHGIGEHCGFRDAYLAELGLSTLEEFYCSRYANKRDFGKRVDPARFLDARRAVFQPAMFTDPVTCRMLERYAGELAEILTGMARKLGFGGGKFDLVLSGSLLTRGRHPALNGTLSGIVGARFPGAETVVVDGLPVEGAVRIAKEAAGVGGVGGGGVSPRGS
jgi:N-acetylglucosamine kinase-like BadF-type ATPase